MTVQKNVVQMSPRSPAAATTRMSERKWGRKVMEAKRFSIIPSLLLHAQARLKMTPTHLAIVMHLNDFWWAADRKPWPAKATLAERMGLSSRQVQRQMAELEKMGLIQRKARHGPHGGKLSNEYDLSGLVARLKELAPEFKAVEEEARKRHRAVARPGLRKRAVPGDEE